MTVTNLSQSVAVTEAITEHYVEGIKTMRWERIKSVMDFLGWKWVDNDRVPTIDEMKRLCDQLFSSCLANMAAQPSKTIMTSSAGGFRVEVNRDTRRVRTSFEVDYSANYID